MLNSSWEKRLKTDPMIDIVVPLYNEEKVLAKSVKTIIDFLSQSGFPYPYRLTLANNASTDRSWDICQELARMYPEVRPLNIGAKGKGHAVRTAWSQSPGKTLVFMDCDLASDLAFLRPLVEAVHVDGAHMAIGSRLGPGSVIVSRHPVRGFASRIYNLCARRVLRTPFADHQCGFKAMDKRAFDTLSPHLSERGWVFDTEMLVHAVKRGYRVTSLDIVWREGEESKVSLVGDSVKMFGDLLRLRRRLSSIPA